MDLNRRNFLALGIGGVLATCFAEARAEKAEAFVSAQTQLVWTFLQVNGHHNFVILDKHNAELVVVENGREIFRSPALYGKAIGDDETKNRDVTPAGSFFVDVKPSDKAPGTSLYYLCDETADIALCKTIHPTATAARITRYGQPDRSAVSGGGCVNLPFENYSKVADFFIRHARDASRPLFVVLPQNPDLDKTRAFFGIPSGAESLTPNGKPTISLP